MKKKVTIVVVIVLVIVLIAACVMWRIGGVETESELGDHQKYVYAYVSSIEGNEVTYMEVDESVAKAAEERAKEKAKAEDGAGSDSTGQGDKSDGGTDSAGQRGNNDGSTGSAGQSDNNDGGSSTDQSDKNGGTGSDEDKSGMGTPPDMDGSSGGDQTPPDMSGASTDIESTEQSGQNQAPSDMGSTSTDTESTEQSGQMQMPPDKDSTEMPQGTPGGISDMTGETVTTMIPVGVTVHTTSDTTTTFSRLASGDLLKILVETDSDGNEVIEEIWMLQ